MITLLKVFKESIAQAFQQLLSNKLRSFLSLLGISIGIFCIIGVQSAVDSLEANIKGSFDKLGDDVVYINKMPWDEDPGQNFWKYQRRPNPGYKDFQAIKANVKSADLIDYHLFIGMKTIKYKSSSVDRVFLVGATYDFDELLKMNYEKGRWYSSAEYHYGADKVLIGHTVAEELFGNTNPIGKKITLSGRKLEVIAVIEKAGQDILQIMNFDEGVLISYELAKKMVNVKPNHPFGTTIDVKAKEGVSLDQLKDELTGVMRTQRRLRPKEDNNFALNSLSLLAGIIEGFFGALNKVGIFIGGFAIFVGMFSVANIMFVSVKERTGMIGIKKALGAKKYIILLEFLVEAVILCIIGGAVGLGIVQGVVALLSSAMPFDLVLSANNIIWGLSLSIGIGILSGFIPAWQAAGMDPVEAMRK